MNENLSKIKEISAQNKFIPSVNSLLRASVSAIPYIGGVFDHLLFDKADEIRIRNIEQSIHDISKQVQKLDHSKIIVEWFDSDEAIYLFKLLVDKIQFEPDPDKRQTLSEIYPHFSTKEFSEDPNKRIIFNKLSEMTTIQKKFLQVISNTPEETRKIDNEGLTHNWTGIWFDSIKMNMHTSERFWTGVMNLDIELDILESLNLINEKSSPIGALKSFRLTAIGISLVQYLNNLKN